jgi:hypothetical protein
VGATDGRSEIPILPHAHKMTGTAANAVTAESVSVSPILDLFAGRTEQMPLRTETAVAVLRSHRAFCVRLPRLHLRCSGNALRDLDPSYHNPGKQCRRALATKAK